MKILFQGDSVTDAGRTGCEWENLGLGYPLFVAGELLLHNPGKGLSFVNRGISGNRVVDLYQRWKVDCLNHAPDVISILIGINDTWHERAGANGVELDRAEMVMRELLSWTRKARPEARLVLCEPFLFTEGVAGEGYEAGRNWAAANDWKDEVDARRAIVRRFAKEFGAVLVPFQDVLDEALGRAPAPYWLGDGVHPTTAGHALLAKAWIQAAKPLLGL